VIPSAARDQRTNKTDDLLCLLEHSVWDIGALLV
jgi:hypothetical protein